MRLTTEEGASDATHYPRRNDTTGPSRTKLLFVHVAPLNSVHTSYFNVMVFGASEDHVLSTTQFVDSQTCDGRGVAGQLPRGHKPGNPRR